MAVGLPAPCFFSLSLSRPCAHFPLACSFHREARGVQAAAKHELAPSRLFVPPHCLYPFVLTPPSPITHTHTPNPLVLVHLLHFQHMSCTENSTCMPQPHSNTSPSIKSGPPYCSPGYNYPELDACQSFLKDAFYVSAISRVPCSLHPSVARQLALTLPWNSVKSWGGGCGVEGGRLVTVGRYIDWVSLSALISVLLLPSAICDGSALW